MRAHLVPGTVLQDFWWDTWRLSSFYRNTIRSRRRRFWHATLRLHSAICRHHPPQRARFWAKSAASGSVKWCCFRSCWTVLDHVMQGRPSCLLQSAGGEANRILLASALSSMRIIYPNRVSRRDWIIAVFGWNGINSQSTILGLSRCFVTYIKPSLL